MRFLIDSMLPPTANDALRAHGHDSTSPAELGAHNLPDGVLIELASADGRVIVTENARDFAGVTTCTVLLVRKSWWPRESLVARLATAIDCWARRTPEPGPWAHWLPAACRED